MNGLVPRIAVALTLYVVVACGGGNASSTGSSATGPTSGTTGGTLVGTTGGTTGGTSGGTTSGTTGGTTSARWFGVTIDNVSGIEATVDALASLHTRPMARIVFDPGLAPSDYSDAVRKVGAVADILGQPVDSSEVAKMDVAAYRQRMADYMDAFRGQVRAWEIGNEVNGEWLGTSTDVAAKIEAAYDEAKTRGLPTVLTLYFNSTCVEDPAHEMMRWLDANVSVRVRTGVDVVLVSYYPDDCAGTPDWPSTFGQIAAACPQARLGFGELGRTKDADKSATMREFYRMAPPVARWVGGVFWWTFKEDATPKTKPLWTTLDALSGG